MALVRAAASRMSCGRQAFTQHPHADGLYIGGSSWLSEPVCQALEHEFGRPADLQPELHDLDTLTRLAARGPFRPRGGF
jgi:hypothetical protein